MPDDNDKPKKKLPFRKDGKLKKLPHKWVEKSGRRLTPHRKPEEKRKK